MEYTKEWMLTDQEIAQIEAHGGDIAEAQEEKKQAYREAGGIILNPEALPELYEGLKAIRPLVNDIKPFGDATAQQISVNAKDLILENIEQALSKAEEK